MRPRLERRRRLVESNVAVLPDAEDDKIQSAPRDKPALVARRFCSPITRAPVQKLDPLGRQVDVREQVLPHERVIALRIARPESDELVQIERRRVAKIDAAGAIEPRELGVERHRRASGRQAQHRRRRATQRPRKKIGEPARGGFRRSMNHDAHHSPASR
jgi:hypothetical protein